MRKLLFVFGLLMSFIWGGATVEASDRSYEISHYKVQVDIQEDGSVLFTENMTYDFDGAFNGVLFNLDIRGVEEPTDIEVYLQAEGEDAFTPVVSSESGEPKTYELKKESNRFNFTVYQPVEDEELTVRYQYRIPELITNYNDTAVFNHRIIGAGWDEPLYDIDITVTLPEAVAAGDLQAWAHGDQSGLINVEDDNQTVTLSLNRNPANQFVEAQIVFPTSVTASNPNVINEDRYDAIISLEERLANDKQEEQTMLFAIAIALGVAGPILVFFVFRWLKKKNHEANPSPAVVPDLVYDLPEEIPPAVVTHAVFGKHPSNEDVSATLMNLVRKGYLTIEAVDGEEEDFLVTKVKESDDFLLRHEKRLIKWFVDVVGNGQDVLLSEIEAIEDNKKKAKRFYNEWGSWQNDVVMDSRPFTEKYRAPHWSKASGLVILTVIATIFFFVASFFLILMANVSFWLVILPIFSLIYAISLAIYQTKNPALTAEGDLALKEWRAFERMLEEVGDFDITDIGSLDIWDAYLVYAIAFGSAETLVDQMQLVYTEDEIRSNPVGGFYYYYPTYVSYMNHSISHGISSSTPASSGNSGGSGGSFSGGSSGGTGGGSGGGAF